MRNILDIWKIYNFPICVVGGGPNAEEDIKRVPKGTRFIGVNHHCDYFLTETLFNVFTDIPLAGHVTEFCHMATTISGKRVCPIPDYSDWDIEALNFKDFGFTAPLAIRLGTYITTRIVYLAGFDLWQSKETQTHFYKHEPDNKEHLGDLDHSLKVWGEVFEELPRWRLRVLSGPLKELI